MSNTKAYLNPGDRSNIMAGKISGYTVVYEGKTYPVQTRYNKSTGTTANLIIVREERTIVTDARRNKTTQAEFDKPIVLFTTDQRGNTNYGGEGREDRVGFFGDVGDIVVTTRPEAEDIIKTLQVNSVSAGSDLETTRSALLKEHNSTAQALQESVRPPSRGTGSRREDDATPILAKPPIDQSAQEKDPELEDGESTKPNNDENANNSNFLQNIVDQGGELAARIGEFITLDPNSIPTLYGGDQIKGGIYPLDSLYGNEYGQDYVCIDQFEYQAPRRDQIFGTFEGNLINGNQRISPLKKFVAQVKLPMPNNITDSNNVDWGSDVMNNLSAAITSGVTKNTLNVGAAALGGAAVSGLTGIGGGGTVGAIGAILNDQEGDNFLDKIQNLISKVGNSQAQTNVAAAINSRILAAAGVNISPETLLSRGLGVVPNSNLELLFNAPTLREFQFNWKMSPRDEDEAQQVKNIIRFFKQGMAAKKLTNQAGEASLFLGSPNVFRMQFKTQNNKIIEGVNRIKVCAVTGTAVNYTPDGTWAAYDQGQPVSTILTIRMTELEPVYATDYSEDVIGSRRSLNRTIGGFVGPLADPDEAFDPNIPVGDGDLYSIRPTEIGY